MNRGRVRLRPQHARVRKLLKRLKIVRATRRPTVPATQPHRDRKNDYQRQPKHRKEEV